MTTYRLVNAQDCYARESDNQFQTEAEAQESLLHLQELYPDGDFEIEEITIESALATREDFHTNGTADGDGDSWSHEITGDLDKWLAETIAVDRENCLGDPPGGYSIYTIRDAEKVLRAKRVDW